MRKQLWKAAAVAAVLVMTVSSLAALAAEKKSKPATAGKTTEQAMPGCGMKGEAAKAMPGCGLKGEMGMGQACCCAGCGMHGGMKGCGMKGEMAKGMPGGGMSGGMGRGMAGGMMGGPGMMGRGMAQGHGPMMLQGLDLTAEQQKKLADIHERQARVAIQAQADLRLAAMDLQRLMRADNPDKPQIDAQIDRVAQLRAQLQKSHTATLLEVRAMLTPEQVKKWHELPMGDMEEDD